MDAMADCLQHNSEDASKIYRVILGTQPIVFDERSYAILANAVW